MAQWGPTIRVDVYKYITQDLQFREITAFLGDPRTEWRDPTMNAVLCSSRPFLL
jgi:hypothetical protein